MTPAVRPEGSGDLIALNKPHKSTKLEAQLLSKTIQSLKDNIVKPQTVMNKVFTVCARGRERIKEGRERKEQNKERALFLFCQFSDCCLAFM